MPRAVAEGWGNFSARPPSPRPAGVHTQTPREGGGGSPPPPSAASSSKPFITHEGYPGRAAAAAGPQKSAHQSLSVRNTLLAMSTTCAPNAMGDERTNAWSPGPKVACISDLPRSSSTPVRKAKKDGPPSSFELSRCKAYHPRQLLVKDRQVQILERRLGTPSKEMTNTGSDRHQDTTAASLATAGAGAAGDVAATAETGAEVAGVGGEAEEAEAADLAAGNEIPWEWSSR